MSKKRNWQAQTFFWVKKYGEEKPYSPANTRAARERICTKCGSKEKVSRHHKGHEYAFALILEDIYAPRYIQFHPDDVVPLCHKCHTKIHKLYEPILLELRMYLESYKSDEYNQYGYPIWASRPDYAVLESYRKRLVAKCDRWLKDKITRVSRATKKEY